MQKKLIAFSAFLLTGYSAFSQIAPAADQRPQPMPPDFLSNPYFWLFAFFLLVLVLAIIVMGKAFVRISKSMLPAEEKPHQQAAAAARPETAVDTFLKKLTDTVPLDKEEDILMHHNYDGIRELDNNLPPWWKYGFYLTIVFAFVYLLHYHVFGTGKLQIAEYDEAMKEAEAIKMANAANSINKENVVLLIDAAAIANGKQIFTKNCTPCHGPDGGGNQVGPNLTDQYWINGGGIHNVFNTITEGVAAKGMISWKSQLSPKQIQEVGSFILSLQGSNPAGGKAPQGTIWTEDGAIVADSTAALVDTTTTAVVDTLKK